MRTGIFIHIPENTIVPKLYVMRSTRAGRSTESSKVHGENPPETIFVWIHFIKYYVLYYLHTTNHDNIYVKYYGL